MALKRISKSKLKLILEKHKKWLQNEPDGKMANLESANLESANLEFANLRSANLRSANLEFANLESANLRSANLESANLESANLRSANLRSANLRSANLRSANLDLSVFPLCCGSFKVKVDDRLVMQLVCHLTRMDTSACSEEGKEVIKAIWKYRNKFCKYRTDVKEI